MKWILLASILLIACSSELDIVSGPFLIKDGLTYHQATNKLVTGITQDFYENGQLKSRTTFRGGKQHGLYESFYKSGQLKKRAFYASGLLNGSQELFDSNGQLEVKENYVKGTIHGVQKFYSKGIMRERSVVEMGNWTGPLQLYYEDGNLMSKVEFINSRRHGTARIFYKSGQLGISGQYKNHKKHGLFNSYSSDGKEYASWQCDLGKYVKGTYKLSVGKINEVMPFVENNPFNGAVFNPFDQENPRGIEIDGKTYYLCSTYNLEGSI
jgi:antitoxin component YwqK of YwqJK toxin-antitoxin module